MGKILPLLLFLTRTAAAVAPCDPDPPAATPPPSAVQALLHAASQANRYHKPGGLAATACVGRNGVFYSATLIPPAELEGPAVRARGFAVLAWLLGAQQFHFGGIRSDPDADRAGARAAGCALAHVGAKGNDMARQVEYLEAATTPHADAYAWRVALTEGYESCAQ